MTLQTTSNRLKNLPKYIFVELDRKKNLLQAEGVDLINLGIGDPDLPPPEKMIEALKMGLSKEGAHRYPTYDGALFFKEAIAEWLEEEHGVSVDPKKEVLVLIGSKEGLAHLPLAVTNPGDRILTTNPGYPAHYHSIILSECVPDLIELNEENHFLPDFSKIGAARFDDAKLFFLNYPNNPTSATATENFFDEAIAIAKKHNLVLCHDAAYIDVSLEGRKQPALMSNPEARKTSVEFYSLSKMFNVCGWRLGFCAGNADIIASLGRFKNSVDSGQFTALQWAGAEALRECLPDMKKTLSVYKERRKLLCAGLKSLGLNYFKTDATFYIWARVPSGKNSFNYANELMEEHGIIATPGVGFGEAGDDYIRFSLTAPTDRIKEALKRMKKSA